MRVAANLRLLAGKLRLRAANLRPRAGKFRLLVGTLHLLAGNLRLPKCFLVSKKQYEQIQEWKQMEEETLAAEQRRASQAEHRAPRQDRPQLSAQRDRDHAPSDDVASGGAAALYPPGMRFYSGKKWMRGKGWGNWQQKRGGKARQEEPTIESATQKLREAKRQIEEVERKSKRARNEVYDLNDQIGFIPNNSPLFGNYQQKPPATKIWRKNNRGKSATFTHSHPDPQARRPTDAVQDDARGPRPTPPSASASLPCHHRMNPRDEDDDEDDNNNNGSAPSFAPPKRMSGTPRGRGRGKR